MTDQNPPASRFLALRAPEISPLFGRDEELDLLLRRWEHAKAGRGRLVLVGGDPGIGKSRLLHAFEQCLPPEAVNTLRYFCSPHRAERAFFAVIEQFERAAGFLRADSAEERVGKLESLLAPSAVSDEQISLIADLVGIESRDRLRLPEFPPHQRKDKVLAALVAQIRGLAARRPVLVLYEDLQWIDPSSLELLSLLVERIVHLPVLVLATARPEFRP